MTDPDIVLTVELTDAQAQALAQFVKRVGWLDFKNNAADLEETVLISDAVNVLRKELAAHGFAPR